MSKKQENIEIQNAEKLILKWVPIKEHNIAKQIIYRAAKKGFTNISILPPPKHDDYQYEPTIRDIVADGPDGKFYFLYGKI